MYGLDALVTVFFVSLVLTVLNVWYLLVNRASAGSGTLVGFTTVIAIIALANLLMPRVAVEPVGVVAVPTNYTTAVVTTVNGTTTTTTAVYVVNLTTTVFRPSGLSTPYFGLVTIFLFVNAFVVLLYMFTVVFPRIMRRV